MAESSTNPDNNSFNIRSTLSNEHLFFAETLRDWRDPLLHGPKPIPLLLCPRCTTCKCDSLKELRSHHHHIHNSSCPNFHQQHERTKSSNIQRSITKFKRRAISLDPSIRVLKDSSSIIKSKSTEHSPLTNLIKRKKFTSKIPVRISPSPTNEYSPPSPSLSFILNYSSTKETKIPRLILTRSLPLSTITTDELYEIDSLDDDADNEDTLPKEKKTNNQLDNMDKQILMKKKKKRRLKRSRSLTGKQQQRYQHKEGRHSKSKIGSNDLSSSSSSSSLSLSIVPLREKSRSNRLISPSDIHSSLSDDSLSETLESKPSHQSRPRSAFISTPSLSTIYKTKPMNSFGLTKTITDVWKSTKSNKEHDFYPRYSTEYTQPIKTTDKHSIPILSRNIILQRGQTDYWQNCETFHDSMITSSCESSTGSASHLLSPLVDDKHDRNSNGHIISITTTKRHQSSLLNKSKNIQWNIKGDGKQLRYSKIKSHSDDQLHKNNKSTDTGSSSEQTNRSVSIIDHHKNEETTPIDVNSKKIDSIVKQISYASTDEDVDELNSHCSDVIDRSMSLMQTSREKFNTRSLSLNTEQNDSNTNSLIRSRIFSTECSQITFDSGVDINSEQKLQQINSTLTIDEQLFEEITDKNDIFILSDESLIESQITNILSTSINQSDQDTYFSVKNQLNNQNDPYSGYELEVVSDEENDYHDHEIKQDSNELILTSEIPTSPTSLIPPQFELKLPSFSEWIDRVFTTFLTETSQNQPLSISSNHSSVHGSQSTINTSSSSQAITVLENENLQSSETQDDDEHSLNDMSSSSLNCEEKVDFDTYIINSNYEKINPSITNEPNEILFLNERSKSLLSSITSSIENDGQDVMNNGQMQNDDDDDDSDDNISKQIEYQYSSNSRDSLLQSDHPNLNTTTSSTDDLTRTNQLLSSTFYSKDSALGLSDDNLNNIQSNELIIQEEQTIFQDKIDDNNEIAINIYTNIYDDTIQKSTIMDEHDQSIERTISSSSSEQLIPKEKQTGMYYKAFGSSAAIHLAEQYNCEWLQDISVVNKSPELDDNHLRIVHQCQTLGDNEDEFYFSPQILQPSYSCPNLYSNPNEFLINHNSYSLTTLDAYTHLNITHETLEQIWLSLLDVAFSDKDDYELGEYKLRHIIGLSNSYSNINQTLIEKSRSHNDIFSTIHNNKHKSIIKTKSKSFDITSLMKTTSFINNDSNNLGLLQGADISEPFADRFISTSMHSDLESIQSLEHEQIIPIENLSPSSPIIKESLDYVFNFSCQTNNDEFDFEIDDKPLNISPTFDTDDIPPPLVQLHDTYTELSLFRPHSLSTIPSSRASQYASSVDSDDMFENERHLDKENSENNYQYHVSDDDHGVIGSEFSSPQSRPLSSLKSRSLSFEENEIKSLNDLIIDEYSNNLTTIIPIELIDDRKIYTIDQIEPILLENKNSKDNFIEKIDENINQSSIQQDYITIEQQLETHLNPNELSQRLEQLDLSNKQEEITHIIEKKSQINPPRHYQTQRIDKVSDLEIVKQGKGFRIGYIDRQGTEPRVILTKHIDTGSDIMERDPHFGLSYKGRRILNQIFSSVLYTNGYNSFQEDDKFQRSSNDIEVPIIGTDPKHFDESDMVSIDIDGPSTILNSICESIIITQGSFYKKPLLEICEPIKKDKIKVIDSWHDCTVINGNSTPWRSPFKPIKSSQTIKQEKSFRDVALSPIIFDSEEIDQIITTPPLKVDRSCQYSPPPMHDQGLQCCFENSTSYEIPGYLKGQNINSPIRTIMALERSADSGILVDDSHRMKSNLALQVDIKSSSSDSEDISEVTTRPLHIYENTDLNISTTEIDQEIIQLNRERAHVLDLLSLNWTRSNIWVELTEAKLNYIIGETDALLKSLSLDSSSIDNETVKLKMHRYEEDMAELTRQHLAVYREHLEDSKKKLDMKIDELKFKKSSIENQSIVEQIPRLLNTKRLKSFLSTSAENLTIKPNQDTITSHPQFLDISFLASKNSDQYLSNNETIHRPIPRYSTRNLSNLEGLSQSQQAIIDETDKLVKDSQQLHTEAASQFERARESLLSSETSIRLARENLAASRYSGRKTYLSHDVTLAELFKYEQSLAKEAAKTNRHVYSTTEF